MDIPSDGKEEWSTWHSFTKPRKVSLLFSSQVSYKVSFSPLISGQIYFNMQWHLSYNPSGAESNLRESKLKSPGEAHPEAVCFT